MPAPHRKTFLTLSSSATLNIALSLGVTGVLMQTYMYNRITEEEFLLGQCVLRQFYSEFSVLYGE